MKTTYIKASEVDKKWYIIDKDFNAHQSGGRMIKINNDEIVFSIGDYRFRHLSQK